MSRPSCREHTDDCQINECLNGNRCLNGRAADLAEWITATIKQASLNTITHHELGDLQADIDDLEQMADAIECLLKIANDLLKEKINA